MDWTNRKAQNQKGKNNDRNEKNGERQKNVQEMARRVSRAATDPLWHAYGYGGYENAVCIQSVSGGIYQTS